MKRIYDSVDLPGFLHVCGRESFLPLLSNMTQEAMRSELSETYKAEYIFIEPSGIGRLSDRVLHGSDCVCRSDILQLCG